METERRVPCNYCREKHLKCNLDETPCAHCSKLGKNCVRARKRIRFSRNKRLDASLGFSEHQTWVQTKNADRLSFVDATPQSARREISVSETQDVDVEGFEDDTANSSEVSGIFDNGNTIMGHSEDAVHEAIDNTITQTTSMQLPGHEPSSRLSSKSTHHSEHDPSNIITSRAFDAPSFSPVSPGAQSDSAAHLRKVSSLDWRSDGHVFTSPSSLTPGTLPVRNIAASPLDTALQNRVPSSALQGLPEGFTEDAYLQLQEACLMRHFIDNLAPWFEITDRDRHYSVVVPQRAMFCPVLLHAIFTASARHLTRSWQKAQNHNMVEFQGVALPGLDDQTAIHYHNKCINCLIEISNNPSLSYNEDALTAATILRFYEQIDTPFTGQDSETYLNVVRAVVETQQDESFYSIRKIHGPLRDIDPFIPVAVSLRHSACLIALRQEIWSVLLYRRPIQLPIAPDNDYELVIDPPPADDFVWTNRILVWTADVLKFCFGGLEIRRLGSNSNNPSPSLNVDSKSRVDHWNALKRFEGTWQLQQPASFKPIFYRPSNGEHVFPAIWYGNDVHALGHQHFEIASLMLSVYDPRLPRLGLGALSAQRSLAARIRKSTLKICGLAMSHRRSPPLMVDAAVVISICGSYFENSKPTEQTALVDFLERVEFEHAWPTENVITALKDAWSEGTPR